MPCSVNPRARGAAYGSKWELHKEIVLSVKARAQGAAVSWSRLLVLLFVVILAVPAFVPSSVDAASLKDQIAAAKERQAALTQSIAKSERLVSQLQAEEAQTKRDLDQTTEDLKDIRTDQAAVKARIEKVQQRLKRIEARHAELVEEQRQTDFTLGLLEQELANGETDLKARREALGRRLAEAYRTENTTLLDQLFTAESFSDVLTDTSAYLSYGDQDAQLARQITQDQQALDSLRLLTTSTRLRTDQLRRETLDTQAKVMDLRVQLGQAKRALAKLEARTEKARERQEAQMRVIASNKKEAQAVARKMVAQRNALRSKVLSLVAAAQAKAAARFGGGGGSGPDPVLGAWYGRPTAASARTMAAPAITSTRPVARVHTGTTASISPARVALASLPRRAASSPTPAGTRMRRCRRISWSSPMVVGSRPCTHTCSPPGRSIPAASSNVVRPSAIWARPATAQGTISTGRSGLVPTGHR